MLRLDELVAAIAEDLVRARAASDLESARVALAYEEEPLLAGLPAPRVRLEEALVELPLVALGPLPPPASLVARSLAEYLRYWLRGRSADVSLAAPLAEELAAVYGRGDVKDVARMLPDVGAEPAELAQVAATMRFLAERGASVAVAVETAEVRGATAAGAAMRVSLKFREEGLSWAGSGAGRRLVPE